MKLEEMPLILLRDLANDQLATAARKRREAEAWEILANETLAHFMDRIVRSEIDVMKGTTAKNAQKT